MRKTLISLAAVMATCAAPALAKDYILAPARPDKLIVVDTEKMAVEKVITISALSTTTQIMAQPTPATKRHANQLQKPIIRPRPAQPAAKMKEAR